MFPYLYQSESFSIESYHSILLVAIAICLLLFYSQIRELNKDSKFILSIGIVFILLGNQFYHLFTNPNTTQIFSFQNKFSSIGAIFGGLIALLLISYFFKIHLLYLLDRFALVVCLGYAIAKLACLSAGCCYGIPYHGPGNIVFSNALCAAPPLNIPLFPVQITDSILSLLIFIFLFLQLRKEQKAGFIFALFCVIFSLFRFSCAFLRAELDYNLDVNGFYLPVSQWLFLGLFVLGLCLFVYFNKAKVVAEKF